MATAFYDLTVGSYLQTTAALEGVLQKGLAHCTQAGADPDLMVEARLAADMLPLAFQVRSVAHHSIGALDGIRRGSFRPPGESPPLTYAGLQAILADAYAALEALTPAEVNALEGRDLVFSVGGRDLPFTAEQFVLSFSLPNFYFHAATAYDLLRLHGVPVGKRDYLGRVKTKG